MKRLKRRNSKDMAVAQDAQTIAKLSALVTAAQARHDAMLAQLQAAEAKAAILAAMLDAKDEMLTAVTTAVDRETFPPLGCEQCRGGWIDEIDYETGEVYVRRCPSC